MQGAQECGQKRALLAGVASTEPDEVSFLYTGSFNSNASFEEGEPAHTVLCGDCLE